MMPGPLLTGKAMTVNWQKKRLLIWGTTYPEFSRKHYETVCTGAIDGDTGRLIRIYPVTLRYMKEPFRRYQWIEAGVARNMSDFRPESYKINQDSIRLLERLETDDGWVERSKWVLRPHNVFPSVRALQEAEERDHTSLGLVRPKKIVRVYPRRRPEKDREAWEQHREEAIRQRDLLVDAEVKTRELKYIPIRYHAEFICDDPACSTQHDMSILDWGVYVLHLKQEARGTAERDVVARILDYMDATKREAYFFLGNTKEHSKSFMIVGLYHPPLPPPPKPPKPQLSLF
jgi:hypothetical protein